MLRHGLGRADDAERIEAAVDAVLERGLRTPDLAGDGGRPRSATTEVTEVGSAPSRLSARASDRSSAPRARSPPTGRSA